MGPILDLRGGLPAEKERSKEHKSDAALRALPCAGVPTAERRTTALGCPITIALSDAFIPFAARLPLDFRHLCSA